MANIRLFNMDCRKAMKEMSDNAFDLAICDPPYGIKVNGMNMGSRQTIRPDKRTWDAETPPPEYFRELRRVSKQQIIWGGNYFDLPPSRCFLIWDKGETMYGRDFAECEQAWTSFDRSARMFKQNPMQLNRIHPTQKPVKLYEWLLKNYAKPGDKILDTHLGSGSIAVACYNLGFDMTGYEIDKDYYNAAVERLERHKKQIRLFENPAQQKQEKQEKLL